MRVLILGGTGEANRLAAAVSDCAYDAVYSYAGRTAIPAPQPLPTRTGGFGGADGLAEFLRDGNFTHVVDATHPFAAEMSRHAVAACDATGIPLMALERAPWQRQAGDTWNEVPNLEAAATALPEQPAHVFLAIGRQHLKAFAAKPQHTYTLRFVDHPDGDLPFPQTHIIVDRGPFTLTDELELLRSRSIDVVVARNSGGDGAFAKIEAARNLGLPVVMIGRPALPERQHRRSVADVVAWLSHEAHLGA